MYVDCVQRDDLVVADVIRHSNDADGSIGVDTS